MRLATDKYRAAAKQAAWYSEHDDPNPNYNPFRKTRTRPKDLGQADDENGLQPPLTNRSESQLTPSIELQRRLSNQEALQQQFKHADTMPSSSKTSTQPFEQSSSGISPVDKQSSIKDFSRDNEKSQDSGQGSGTTDSSTAVGSTEPKAEVKEGKPRRRFTKKFPFVTNPKKEGDAELGEDAKRVKTGSSLFGKETQQFTAASQLRATVLNSWINVLLIFVPIGIAVNFANVPKVGVFVINFIAIIPLAAMLSYATEEIALRTGETIGGLLNATFG